MNLSLNRISITSIIPLLFCLSLHAQKGKLVFQRYAQEEGLSQNSVYAILQDRRGFIWLGTRDGLNRFDGYRFKVFKHQPGNPQSLGGNRVMALVMDHEGVIWAGSDGGGLNRFDEGYETFTRFRFQTGSSSGSNHDKIQTMIRGRNGNLWIGTDGAGLDLFDPQTATFQNHAYQPENPHSLSSNYLTSLCEDQQGNLWIGTWSDGLCRLDVGASRFARFRHDPSDPGNTPGNGVRSILEDRSGRLWVAATTGLFHYDRERQSFVSYTLDGPWEGRPRDIRSLFEDRDGNLLIGSMGTGLFRLDAQRDGLTHYQHDPSDASSLSGDMIYAISQDAGKVLWVGVSGGGVNKADPQSERFLRFGREKDGEDGLTDPFVWAILEDSDRVLWFGSRQGGLTLYDQRKKRFQHLQHDPNDPNSLSHDRVNFIHQDGQGNVWVGTDAGLNKFDKTTGGFQRFFHEENNPHSLARNKVNAMLEDSNGSFWISVYGAGMDRFNPETGRATHFPPQSGGPTHDQITTFWEDARGLLWIGTAGGGLMRMQPSQSPTFDTFRFDSDQPDGLGNDHVISLYQRAGRDDILWIGTEGGLGRLHKPTSVFSNYTEVDGLPNDVIYAILSDGRDGLWVSTNRGLARLNPEDGSVETYDARDGLQANEFNRRACFRGRDGALYFGGINGITAFYPDRWTRDFKPPSVSLTQLRIANQSVELRHINADSPLERSLAHTSLLELTYKEAAMITLEFAATDHGRSDRIRYAYRMGDNNSWVETDADNRRATYTDLSAGEYRFQVKAVNRDGSFSTEPASLRLRIHPPPWLSWWAKILYILLLVLMVQRYLQAQKRKLIHQRDIAEKERQTAVRLRHLDQLKDEFLANTSHELRTPLNGIIGLAESLRDSDNLSGNARLNLTMIIDSGRRLAGLVNDLLDFSKLQKGNLDLDTRPVDVRTLVDVVFRITAPLVKGNVELVNRVEPTQLAVLADENRLLQVLHNLVGNAVKFTSTGSVSVSAVVENQRLAVSVCDTGPGISENDFERIFQSFSQVDGSMNRQHEGAGLGLAITRELLKLQDGDIRVSSTLNQGSVFTFTLPLAGESVVLQGKTEQTLPEIAGKQDVALANPEAAQYHVLVVDDDPVNLQVLANYLTAAGYRVTTVENGSDALDLLGRENYHLILLDIMMPGMSGFEACRKIREQHQLQQLPVMFLTARIRTEDLEAGFECGANDYLTKPFSKAELLARVRTHLQLVDTHRKLDRRVAERTRDLHRKNEELSISRDVLEEQAGRLEDQTRKLMEMDELKTRFFNNISHELRTPLTLVLSPLEDLVEEPRGELRLFQAMLRNARRLLTLINQLLELASLEAGAGEVRLEPMDLVRFMQTRVMAFSTLAESREISSSFSASEPTLILSCDVDKLEKIAANLLSNAFKYTPSGGKVLISVERKQQWACLSVKDTGVGIPEERLPHVFDRFYQAGNAVAGSQTGTGIGLALTHELVTVLGGEISASSQQGFGSEFVVKLPIREGDEQLETPETTDSPPPVEMLFPGPEPQKTRDEGKPVIALIEDNGDVRTYIRDCLEPHFTVAEAVNGGLGLRLVWEIMPDLVVCDVMLPEIDGFEVCRVLKKDERSSHVPVILLTARSSLESKLAGLEKGADDYLVKPFRARELLARVRNLIETRQSLRERFSQKVVLPAAEVDEASMDETFLRDAGEVIEQFMAHERFDVLDLAGEMGFSRRQLHRKFTALTGKGPGDYIRRYRLSRAAQLLAKQTGNVSEIAYRVGFKSATHFAKRFREVYNQSPSEYARDHAEKRDNPT